MSSEVNKLPPPTGHFPSALVQKAEAFCRNVGILHNNIMASHLT